MSKYFKDAEHRHSALEAYASLYARRLSRVYEQIYKDPPPIGYVNSWEWDMFEALCDAAENIFERVGLDYFQGFDVRQLEQKLNEDD